MYRHWQDIKFSTKNITNLERERRHKREETGIFFLHFAEENADAEIHERIGKVDHLLTDVADCESRYRQVRSLNRYFSTSLNSISTKCD